MVFADEWEPDRTCCWVCSC